MDKGNKSSVVAVAVTNEKNKVSCNKYIHDDLAFYVISKLPIKSMKRFGCVRKSWSILFENSHFMTMYRGHFISNNNHSDSQNDYHTFLLIHHPELPVMFDHRYHAELCLLSNERIENSVKLSFPPPFQKNDDNLRILGSTSVNGILCLEQHRRVGDPNKVQFVLWNPATDESVLIPPAPDEFGAGHPDRYTRYTRYHFSGFGYDQVRDDFKVFQYVTFDHIDNVSYAPLFEIYSLKSNSWRILDIDMPNLYYGRPDQGLDVYMNGMCHFMGTTHSDQCLMMSFDLSNEVFFTTPVDENSGFEFIFRYLVVLNGSIALISNHYDNAPFNISILGELGVKESWPKLFSFGPLPSIEWPLIGVGKKGYIFFRKNDELACVDLSTQIIEDIGIKGEQFCCQIGIYKEIHLLIGGLNN